MAKKRARMTPDEIAQLPPRRQAPILLGLDLQESALITRAAARLKMPRMTFARESVLFQARDVLGLKQPGDGE